jgi:sugar lactone lactonase YvrE
MFKSVLPALLLACALLSCNDSSNSTKTITGVDTALVPPADEPARVLELVFYDDSHQITGLAKAEGSGLLVNYPRWGEPYRYAVAIAHSGARKIPYPDEAMNTWQPGQPGTDKWVCVQSVYYDDAGNLWVLDAAAPELKTVQGGGPKLVKMNRATGLPDRVYALSPVLTDTSYANDVRVDANRNFAYISESKGGGIVVIDLGSGKMRRVLAAHPSTLSDPAFTFIIDGKELMKDGKPVKINSDGIALTPDGSFLYYKPLSDDKLYRVPTDVLRDWAADEQAIAAKVEDLGHFTTTDGMIFDKAGNLYLGDLQQNRIMRISGNHQMTELLRDSSLIWPDSYSIAEGFLYISCSQIHKQPAFNEGLNKRNTPYAVYRMKL